MLPHGWPVQRAGLAANCINDAWVAVPNVERIIIAIQIFTPVSVPQPNTVTFHEMERIVIDRRNVGAHKLGPISDKLRSCAAHNSILIPSRPTISSPLQ